MGERREWVGLWWGGGRRDLGRMVFRMGGRGGGEGAWDGVVGCVVERR